MSMCSHCLEIYERKKLMLCIAVRNASEKTGTVAITETGVTSIVLITLSSLSVFEDVGMILYLPKSMWTLAQSLRLL